MYCCKTLTIVLFSLLLGIATAVPDPRRIHHHKTKAQQTTTARVLPTHIAPSTCQTYYPSVLRQLHEAQPDVMQANTANTTRSFHVAQAVSSADKVKFDRIHQHVVFENISPGSWDCQLMVSWPDSKTAGMVVSASSRRGTAAASGVSLDVYSASYNATAYNLLTQPKGVKLSTSDADGGPFSTWTSMMRSVKMMGNNALSNKGDNSKGQDKSVTGVDARLAFFGTVPVNPGEYGRTINSEACASATTGDGDGKTLEFLFEIPNFDTRDTSVQFSANKEKGAGVYLLANC